MRKPRFGGRDSEREIERERERGGNQQSLGCVWDSVWVK